MHRSRPETETGARQVRIFAAGIATETNTFSPIPTAYEDFKSVKLESSLQRVHAKFFGQSFRAYAEAAQTRNAHLLLGSYGFATPAGPPARATYERLRDELLTEARAVMPLDGVLLTLHGAMVCDGVDDCESDIVLRMRQMVGPAVKIGVLLDLHCDIPEELLDAADVVITVKEYPHVDVQECALRLAQVLLDAIDGRIKPVMASFDCRMVGFFPTVTEPMRGFVDNVMLSGEKHEGVLAISLAHGFPYLDAPCSTARVVVVADEDREKAKVDATRVGQTFYAMRREVTMKPVPLERGLEEALEESVQHWPVVLADVADNAGGGAASDSTFILRALLERQVRDVALGPVWDPIAVQLAFASGNDSQLTLRLGGKMGPTSGDPLDVTARVRGLVRNLVQVWPQMGWRTEIEMGDAACVEIEGIDVTVVSVREQAFGLELFTAFGVDLSKKRLIVLKSANHFRAAYDAIAWKTLYVEAPGALPSDPRVLPYRKLDRLVYPWVEDPLGMD